MLNALTSLCLAGALAGPLSAHVHAGFEEGTFDSNGVEIRFLESGGGETPVVLLHGFAARLEMYAAAGLVDAFGADHWVLAMDARGHGRSAKPHDPRAYGLEMVEDVVRLLDHVGAERAHVVGYSMGGMITLKLIERHPERLLSAVVGGYGWPEVREGERLMDRVAASLEQGDGFGPLFAAIAADSEAMTPEQIRAIDRALLATNDAAALAAAARGFAELDLVAERLPLNAVPTLALVGELDPLRRDVERLRGVMGALEIVVIDGADHSTTGGTATFRERALAFLAEHAPTEALAGEAR